MIRSSQMSLKSRILWVVGFSSGLCATVAITGFFYFNQKALEHGIENKERTIHLQLSAATEFVAKQKGLDGVIEKFKSKYKSPDELTEADKQEILNQVPIYASMQIGRKNQEKDHYQFRVFSNEPRKPENLATAEELVIFKNFESHPEVTEQVVNTGKIITMYQPVRLRQEQGCLTCHGNPQSSPWGNGKDILGYPMENWTDGKLHGVFAITQNIQAVENAVNADKAITPAQILILAIALGALLSIIFSAITINAPLNVLYQISTVLSDSSQEVNEASEQIAASAQKLSQATIQQASSLEQTAASIEEMSSMVAKNSKNAQDTAESSQESRHKAEQGKNVVGQMIHSMDEINDSNHQIMHQINHSNAEMAEMVKVIQEIGNKTKIINDIVFQTKLLSFNASVEAARAGEHGKGFAVVAEEVGNLAQMSGNAAKEITTMLEVSIQKVQTIVQNTRHRVEGLIATAKQKVENGATVAKECESVLNEIVKNVSRVSQMANEISTASKEQAQGVHELTNAMNQLNQVTQQNSSTSEDSARFAQELSKQAYALKGSIEDLLTTLKGKKREAQIIAKIQKLSKKTNKSLHASEEEPFLKKLSKLPPKKQQKNSLQDHGIPSKDDPDFDS